MAKINIEIWEEMTTGFHIPWLSTPWNFVRYEETDNGRYFVYLRGYADEPDELGSYSCF